MIGTQIYRGQGLGNQLWVYSVIRALSIKNGLTFGFAGRENFKGKFFLDLDFGLPINTPLIEGPAQRVPEGFEYYLAEKKMIHPKFNCDISKFDPQLYNVVDGTFIDGNMQSEKYINHAKDQILSWFYTEDVFFDGCTIHFRGTEYRGLKDVLLSVEYYQNGINHLRDRFGDLDFRVVTDDYDLAKQYFPKYEIIGRNELSSFKDKIFKPIKARSKIGPNLKNIARDFIALQNSRYLLIPNSSFSWWAAWTNPVSEFVIAPKYWARHNISDGFWSTGDILTMGWNWLNREGGLDTYQSCLEELTKYDKNQLLE